MPAINKSKSKKKVMPKVMLRILDRIEDEARYFGSFKELRKIVALRYQGKWEDLGCAKKLVCKDNGQFLVWWPDTGDICHVARQPISTCRGEPCRGDQPANNPLPPRTTSKWLKRVGGKSWPEYFVGDPLSFFEDYDEMIEDEENPEPEQTEVFMKARAIAIPRKKPEKFMVVHRFGPDREYKGFQIEPRGQDIRRHRGILVMNDRIDLSVPWLMCDVTLNTEDSDLTARCLMNAFDDVQPRAWDRAGCEELFNNPANFLPPNLKKPNKLDWRSN